MPYGFTCMWNLKNKINKQAEQKQAYRNREHLEVCQWEGFGEMDEKVKGLISTNWQLQNSHGVVKYSVANGAAKEVIHMTMDMNNGGGIA